jgi:hypothetical protein
MEKIQDCMISYLSKTEAGRHGGGTIEILLRFAIHVVRVKGRMAETARHSKG